MLGMGPGCPPPQAPSVRAPGPLRGTRPHRRSWTDRQPGLPSERRGPPSPRGGHSPCASPISSQKRHVICGSASKQDPQWDHLTGSDAGETHGRGQKPMPRTPGTRTQRGPAPVQLASGGEEAGPWAECSKSVNTAPSPEPHHPGSGSRSAVRLRGCCPYKASVLLRDQVLTTPSRAWDPPDAPPPRAREEPEESPGAEDRSGVSAGPGRSASTQAAGSMEPPPPTRRAVVWLPGPSAHQ